MGAKHHPPEVRAAAVAAVMRGEKPADVAKRHAISRGLLSKWCKADIPATRALDVRGNDREQDETPRGIVFAIRKHTLAELVHELAAVSIESLVIQSRVASTPAWIERQTAAGLASYRGVELDRLLRILPAFQSGAAAIRTDGDGPTIDGDVVDAAARTPDDGV